MTAAAAAAAPANALPGNAAAANAKNARAGVRAGVQVRAVVANPSSFAYLDGRRWSKGGSTLVTPPSGECAGYDAWEYGLEPGPELSSSPYVAQVRAASGVLCAVALCPLPSALC